MSSFKKVFYTLSILITVLARITWMALITTVLLASWMVYNIVTFNVRLLFTRIPWRLKKTLAKSYNSAVFKKALELSFLNLAKQAFSLLSESRSKTSHLRGRRHWKGYVI